MLQWPPCVFPCIWSKSTQFLTVKLLCFGFALTNHIARNYIDRNVYGADCSWTHLKCTPSLILNIITYPLLMLTGIIVPIVSPTYFLLTTNDTDFYFALLDPQFSANLDNFFFESKYFNPFHEDPNTYQLLRNPDHEPDINVLTSNSNLLSKCTYMNYRQFNNLISDTTNPNFSLFHLNIRNLKKTLH